MNIENLRNRVDALQKTENTLLVLAMHKAGLKNVNCSDKQLNLCAVLAGNPVIFKVKEFWMEGDSGKETVFFLGCCDPIEHITLKCEDILPGMVSNILEHIRRTKYDGIQYRLLAFWDTSTNSLVVATHGPL